MDTFKTLQAQAKAKRDQACKAAQAEYQATIIEIRRLRTKLVGPPPAEPRKFIASALLRKPRDKAYHGMTTIQAAEAALRARGPMTFVEIVLDIQSHGCRSQDDPRALIKAIRESFRYHSDKFSCDADKRWSVC